jgi:transcriptional regulator with XRE-family HTH domain
MGSRAETATVRHSLARRLRALREAAGVTKEDVKVRGIASHQKLTRIENGEGPYKPADVRELCVFYRVSPEETEELHAQASALHQGRGFDELRTDLFPPVFGTLVDLESTAERISTYEPDAMPGLLQTADYARAVYQAWRPRHTDEKIERFVAVRLRRQRTVLGGSNPVRICAVLNEAVLARQVGGPQVAAAQLEHVRNLSTDEKVDVRVLTYAAGAHAAMRGSFSLLEFADTKQPSVVYVESSASAKLLTKADLFEQYRTVFESLTEQSISVKEYQT